MTRERDDLGNSLDHPLTMGYALEPMAIAQNLVSTG